MIAIILPVYCENLTDLKAKLESMLTDLDIMQLILVVVDSDPDYPDLRLLEVIEKVQLVTVKRPCRAAQMNAGVTVCEQNYLIFLHADTQLPVNAAKHVINSLQANRPGWGRFDVKLDCDRWIYRLIGMMMNWRSRWTKICTGDQALFMHRDFFLSLGGFKPLPLMEDIEFCYRAKQVSAPICLKNEVITSARRWKQNGVIKTIFLMWLLRLLYWFGVTPERLAHYYRVIR